MCFCFRGAERVVNASFFVTFVTFETFVDCVECEVRVVWRSWRTETRFSEGGRRTTSLSFHAELIQKYFIY